MSQTQKKPAGNGGGDRQIVSVKDLLEKKQATFLQVIPRSGIEPERFLRQAIFAAQNPALDGCTKLSIVNSIFAAASLGLTLDPTLGHAYLVPRKVQGVKVAQFQPGYRGLIELAGRSRRIAEVHVETVDINDIFKVRLGSKRYLLHEPITRFGDGESAAVKSAGLFAAYVTWRDVVTGSIEFHVISKARIDRAKKASQTVGKSFSPWESDEASMWMKTAVHDCKKVWPLSSELARAIELDVAQATGAPQPIAPIITGEIEDAPEAGLRSIEGLDDLDDGVSGQGLNADGEGIAPPSDDKGDGKRATDAVALIVVAGHEVRELLPTPAEEEYIVDVLSTLTGKPMGDVAPLLKLKLPKHWNKMARKDQEAFYRDLLAGKVEWAVPVQAPANEGGSKDPAATTAASTVEE